MHTNADVCIWCRWQADDSMQYIYFMENDMCIVVKTTFMHILSVSHAHLWIKSCIWVLAVLLTQMRPNFYNMQILHTQGYCQNFRLNGVIIILLKFQQFLSLSPCQNFHNLLERFLEMKFYQWAVLSMNCMYKNLQAKTPKFDRTSIFHILTLCELRCTYEQCK